MIWILSNWRIFAYGALVLAVFSSGWYVNGARWESKYTNLETQYATAAQVASEDARKKEKELSDKISSLDKKYTKELKNAKLETERLRASVASGSFGLRVNAVCPDGMPGSTNTTSVGAGTGPRLTSDAEQAYYALRDSIQGIAAQLRACQGILVSKSSPKNP